MGFADLFKPKWKHSNPDVRAEAVRALGDDEATLLAAIARSDADARVRRLAVKRIVDADVLSDVAAHDPDESLRKAAIEKAEEVLVSAAVTGDARALDALGKLGHPRLLGLVALKAGDAEVRVRAVTLIQQAGDDKPLAEVAKKSTDVALRRLIVDRSRDANTLRDIAISDGNKEVALAAVARLDERAALERVAHKAQSKAVRQAARDKLPPPEKKPETPEAQKRARLLALVRTVEQASDPAEVEAARTQFSQEGADDEMRRRFDRTCERFYAKRAATAKSVTKIAAKVAREVVAPVATPAPEQKVVEARPLPVPAVDEEAEQRRAQQERERQQREADKAEARARREAEEKANLERLTQLATDLEGLTIEEPKRGADALKRAQQAFDALGPLGRDAAPQKARWQAARDKLRARVNELYEAEEWKRWANVPKLEALCARAEALLEETDLGKAVAELKQLHVDWKAVGPTTKDKQEQLWQRFQRRRRPGPRALARALRRPRRAAGRQPGQEGGAGGARRGAGRLQRLEGDLRAHQGAAGGVEGHRPGAQRQGRRGVEALPRRLRQVLRSAPGALRGRRRRARGQPAKAGAAHRRRGGARRFDRIGSAPATRSSGCRRSGRRSAPPRATSPTRRGSGFAPPATSSSTPASCTSTSSTRSAPPTSRPRSSCARRSRRWPTRPRTRSSTSSSSSRPSGAPSGRRPRMSPMTCGTASAAPATRSISARRSRRRRHHRR